ncbi:MAG: YjcZ family sporulation protein [Turicibacter sp.]
MDEINRGVDSMCGNNVAFILVLFILLVIIGCGCNQSWC